MTVLCERKYRNLHGIHLDMRIAILEVAPPSKEATRRRSITGACGGVVRENEIPLADRLRI
jgi:hypothetical protein